MTPARMEAIAQREATKYATQDRRRSKHIEHSKARRVERRVKAVSA